MKTLGRSGNNILVSITQEELGAITGLGYYADNVKKAMTGEILDFEVTEAAKRLSIVRRIPADLQDARNAVHALLAKLDIAIESGKALPLLQGKKPPL